MHHKFEINLPADDPRCDLIILANDDSPLSAVNSVRTVLVLMDYLVVVAGRVL